MIVLKFLLVVFLAIVAIVALFLFRLFKSVNDARKQFQNMGHTSGSQQRTSANKDHETIIDHRSEEEARRKIIPKDEGEYVDFTEQ